MQLKKIEWLRKTRHSLKEFPDNARYQAGSELLRVQRGEEPTDWKPLPIVGPGVTEIRIHASNEFRVVYVAKFTEAIYVLHCFEKKTQRTSLKDIDIARSAYAEAKRSHQTQTNI